MSLNLEELVCVPIAEMPPTLCVTLPGGFEVCAIQGEMPPSLFQYAQAALGAANSALAPLGPIFTIIEVITSLFKCIKTIPDCLGPPPNPAKLIKALGDLTALMNKLLKLVPQLSVPLMILQLLDVIIAVIDGAAAELASLARFAQQIAQAETAALTAPALLDMVVCARASLSTQLTNVERVFASINPIIEIINALGGVAGLKPVPSFSGLPADPSAAVNALRDAADALRVVRNAIPV